MVWLWKKVVECGITKQKEDKKEEESIGLKSPKVLLSHSYCAVKRFLLQYQAD